MSKFTVILLYPDYATGDYGADVYVQVARANTAEEAALKVQGMAEEGSDWSIPANDFRPILVLKGDCKVVADATCF